jgi:CRISPR system Cascade subunit CasE
MYLSRCFLNPLSRVVRADLSDVAGLHKTIMRAFPDTSGRTPREEHGVLHRIDEDPRRGRYTLLVQSRTRPDFGALPGDYFLDVATDLDLAAAGVLENPSVRSVDEERQRISTGDRFAFRVHANTTRKIDTKSGPDGARRNGRRVPVRGDEARIAWLERHAVRAGFAITDVRCMELARRSGTRGTGRLTFGGARFDGTLTVTDPESFRIALGTGIGPGKAFGFGLLSIQSIR